MGSKLFIYDSLSKKKQLFIPIDPKLVTFYSCGPTVYDFTHIGHLRKFTTDDLIKKTLYYLGYNVKHAMNITDVGHLSSDSDEGEDKLEKGSARSGKTVWEVAKFFEADFFENIDPLNIKRADIVCKATDHIPQMIEMIRVLTEKGFTYQTDQAIYFDTSKFASYGSLSGQALDDKKIAARADVNADSSKKNPADFALWFFTTGRFVDHQMRWESPWGMGFPGWHIECSAMSMYYLGYQIDIHSGGIDHISVHHENEIAQSEAYSDNSPFVRYWIHTNMLLIDGEKMSKSSGNFTRLKEIFEKGYDPLILRYFFLTTHYRSESKFSYTALAAAGSAFRRLLNQTRELMSIPADDKLSDLAQNFSNSFEEALCDDFNFPSALAIVWEIVKSEISEGEKKYLLFKFDEIFDLGLFDKIIKKTEVEIPEDILQIAKNRLEAKKNKDFAKADKLRQELSSQGWEVIDQQNDFSLKKIT